jgi:DNA polymerase III delta' subunit
MKNAATRGQPRALAEVDSMILGRAVHAVILSGPSRVGKTTLALDLAAGLLCIDPDAGARPCRQCRGCRRVAGGNHPDLHRLAPQGPGGQIKIGDSNSPEPGTARHLMGELSLTSSEGGARIAIVEQAHRLNDDAQNALLKLLEEPPPGVTIILCADDEERLLPTVRSRCVRIRLAAVGVREIEEWLGEQGVADAPRAARLARLADGRPGLALAYARSTDAERLRGEIARGVLDMLFEPRQVRLAAVREMAKSAAALNLALAEVPKAGLANPTMDGAPTPASRGRKGKAARSEPVDSADDDEAAEGEPVAAKLAASDRRAAAAGLMEVWASVGRDLAVLRAGGTRQVREMALLDDLRAVAPSVSTVTMAAFLARVGAVAAQLEENVTPELALDVLALSWPQAPRAAVDG